MPLIGTLNKQPSYGLKSRLRPNLIQGLGVKPQLFIPGANTTAARVVAYGLARDGVTYTNGWNMQQSASPAIDLIGALDLAQVVNPTFNLGSPFAGRRSINFLIDSANRIERPNNADFDLNPTTSLLMNPYVLLGVAPTGGGSREIMGKFQGAGAIGYRIFHVLNTGRIQAQVNDGVTNVLITLLVDHSSQWLTIPWAIDRSDNLLKIATPLASGTASIAAVGTLVATNRFRMGAVASLSAGFNVVEMFVALGAGGAGFDMPTLLSRSFVGV